MVKGNGKVKCTAYNGREDGQFNHQCNYYSDVGKNVRKKEVLVRSGKPCRIKETSFSRQFSPSFELVLRSLVLFFFLISDVGSVTECLITHRVSPLNRHVVVVTFFS